MASAGPWGYLRRLRSFGGGVWVFWIRDATTVRMVRFVRSTIFEVRPRPGRGCWGTRAKTTLAAATAHVRSVSRLVSAPIVSLRPVLPAASLCRALLSLLPAFAPGSVEGRHAIARRRRVRQGGAHSHSARSRRRCEREGQCVRQPPRCPPSGWRPANAARRRASGGSGSTVAINRGASSWVPSGGERRSVGLSPSIEVVR